MKIYMLRHQAGGFIPEFIFAAPPTDQQFGAVKRLCEIRYGTHHGKTKEEHWLRIIEIPVRGPEDLPMPKPPGDSVKNTAGLPPPGVTAVGHVRNPKP
jgi:hypothetical protein